MTAPIGLSLSCMCNSTAVALLESNKTVYRSVDLLDISSTVDNQSCTSLQGKVVKDYGGNFVWSVKMQGYVVSALFVGGFIMAYPAGFIVDRYSARHMMSLSIGLLVFASVIFPTLASFFGPYGAIFSRFLMGFSEVMMIPALNAVVTKWIPLHEKSLAASMFTAGNQVAGMTGTPLAAELCASSLGWPAIFYTGAMFGIVFLILWHLTVRNSPSSTKWIHEKEIEYIKYHIPTKRNSIDAVKKSVPWKSMLTSLPFWALIVNSFMGNMMIALIFVYIPVYFKDVLMLDVQANGFYSAIPHFSNLISKLIWGYFMDKLRQKNVLSNTATVRFSQATAMFGISISCFFLRYMDCSTPIYSLLLLSSVSAFFGVSISGFYTSLLSVAPSHIGVITSISTVIGFIGRIIIPQIISYFKTVGTMEEWGQVFLIYVFASFISALIFGLFGSGEVQEWDYSKTHPAAGIALKALQDGQEDEDLDILD
ncbi:unnamed protein product [Caenorhabditis bovis]|uniref:Major facilitator superfamily (MFS) profile domain-containing protein n=1 Tax=Caenorhabditis bovis TaxID=2654633 RepID=A0A8S1EJP7_9PELO|nr:unnamed protein product [Caenorhabditis bovis]